MNLSSGGLAILAIAAIWFLVFLPSFVKGDQTKTVQAEDFKAEVKANLSEQATRALRSRRTRTISATVAGLSFVVVGLSVLEVISTGTGLPVLIGSTLAFSVAAWLTVRAHRNYVELLSGSVRRAVPVVAPTKRRNLDEVKTEDATWKPEALPKQTFLQTGAIDIVELAEVVSLETEKPAEEVADIDEILRRRRHVG